MNPTPAPTSQVPPVRHPIRCPALAARRRGRAVVIAGVAGGLGAATAVGRSDSRPRRPLTSSIDRAASVDPGRSSPRRTEAPIVTTHLDQPLGVRDGGIARCEDVQERLDRARLLRRARSTASSATSRKMAVWAFEKLVHAGAPRRGDAASSPTRCGSCMQQPMRIEPRRWHSKGQTTRTTPRCTCPSRSSCSSSTTRWR